VVTCTAASKKCISFVNYSGEDIRLMNSLTHICYGELPKNKITLYSITPDIQQALSMIGQKNGHNYGPVPEGQESVIIYSYEDIRPSLKNYKTFWFIPVAVLFLVIAIVAGIMAHRVKINNYKSFCAQDRGFGSGNAQLDSQYCIDRIQEGDASPGNTGYTVVAIIAGIFFVGIIALWLFAAGPLSWTSYSNCQKKNGYGVYWKWTKPRSGFRKFLCTVFGACECSADRLESVCSTKSLTGELNLQWDETKAAKSKSKTDICFCCEKNGGPCINPITSNECKINE